MFLRLQPVSANGQATPKIDRHVKSKTKIIIFLHLPRSKPNFDTHSVLFFDLTILTQIFLIFKHRFFREFNVFFLFTPLKYLRFHIKTNTLYLTIDNKKLKSFHFQCSRFALK